MNPRNVAEAGNRLLDPIDRAHPRAVSDQDLDWLAAHRVGSCTPLGDAGQPVNGMRDEDDR